MGFDIPIQPENLSADWSNRGFNALDMSLDFIRAGEIVIDGWANEPDCEVSLTRNPEGTAAVTISGAGERVSFTAERGRIARIRGYRASAGE